MSQLSVKIDTKPRTLIEFMSRWAQHSKEWYLSTLSIPINGTPWNAISRSELASRLRELPGNEHLADELEAKVPENAMLWPVNVKGDAGTPDNDVKMTLNVTFDYELYKTQP